MSFRRTVSRSPILSSLLFVLFSVLLLTFVTLRQVHSAQNHGLRLLAAFAQRVEITVEDLSQRFARIATTAADESAAESQLGNIQNLEYLDFEKLDSGSDEFGWQVRDGKLFLEYSGPCLEKPEDDDPCPSRQVRAAMDLNAVARPILVSDIFDSILLVDSHGRVVQSQGEPEIRASSLVDLIDSTVADLEEDEPGSESIPEGGRTRVIEAEIAGREYRIFAQPLDIQLRLRQGRPPESLFLTAYGIVSWNRLLASGFTSSPVLLLGLVAIFPLAILAWPFLKLWLISSRQRFTRFDVAALVASSFILAFLLTLFPFALTFHFQLEQIVDKHLHQLADSVESALMTELVAMTDQLDKVGKSEACWPSKFNAYQNYFSERGNIKDYSALQEILSSRERERLPGLSPYPFLSSMFWFDHQGQVFSNLPLSQYSVNTRSVAGRAYVECALEGRELTIRQGDRSREVCLQSVLSNTSGRALAVASKGFDGLECFPPTQLPDQEASPEQPQGAASNSDEKAQLEGEDPSKQRWGVALTTELLSITEAPLPSSYALAVVGTDGDVLFHSDPSRNLTENLLKACDGDPALRSVLAGRRTVHLDSRYLGAPHRIHVEPLEGLPWSLVVLRDITDLRQRTLEMVLDFANPFLLLVGLIYGTTGLLVWHGVAARDRGQRSRSRYLWPDSAKRSIYDFIISITPTVLGLFALVSILGDQHQLFFAAVAIPPMIGALVGSALYFWQLGQRARIFGFFQQRAAGVAETLMTPLPKLGDARQRWRRWLILGFLVWALAGLLGRKQGPASLGVFWPLLVFTVLIVLLRSIYAFRFRGGQRRVAYLQALVCLFILVAVAPAMGLAHLAMSRQLEIQMKALQLEGLQALEERRGRFPNSSLALDNLDWRAKPGMLPFERDDDPACSSQALCPGSLLARSEPRADAEIVALDGIPRCYLASLGMELSCDPGPPSSDELQAQNQPGTAWPWSDLWPQESAHSPDRRATGSLPFLVRLMSFRWISYTDLTRRPTFLDPSRYLPNAMKWHLLDDGPLRGTHAEQWGSGAERSVMSRWPHEATVGSLLSLPTRRLTVILGAACVLLLSPWLLASIIADRVLLISLVPLIRSDERFAWLLKKLQAERPVLLVSSTPDLVYQELEARRKQADSTARDESTTHDESTAQTDFQSFLLSELAKTFTDIPEKNKKTFKDRGGAMLQELNLGEVERPKIVVVGFWPEIEDLKETDAQIGALDALLAAGTCLMIVSRFDPRDLADPQSGELPVLLPRQRWSSFLSRFLVAYGREVERGRYQHWECEFQKRSKSTKRTDSSAMIVRRNFLELAETLEDECDSPRRLMMVGDHVVEELLDPEGVFKDSAPSNSNSETKAKSSKPTAIDLTTTSQLVSHVGHLARAYYQAIWDALAIDEKVVLYQLARDGFTNPRNMIHANDLILKGLIDRNPELRVMNFSFTRFVLNTVSRAKVVEWEEAAGPSAWSVLRWLLPLPLFLLGGYLFVTQPEAFSNVIGLIVALGSIVPIFHNLYDSFQSLAVRTTGNEDQGKRST